MSSSKNEAATTTNLLAAADRETSKYNVHMFVDTDESDSGLDMDDNEDENDDSVDDKGSSAMAAATRQEDEHDISVVDRKLEELIQRNKSLAESLEHSYLLDEFGNISGDPSLLDASTESQEEAAASAAAVAEHQNSNNNNKHSLEVQPGRGHDRKSQGKSTNKQEQHSHLRQRISDDEHKTTKSPRSINKNDSTDSAVSDYFSQLVSSPQKSVKSPKRTPILKTPASKNTSNDKSKRGSGSSSIITGSLLSPFSPLLNPHKAKDGDLHDQKDAGVHWAPPNSYSDGDLSLQPCRKVSVVVQVSYQSNGGNGHDDESLVPTVTTCTDSTATSSFFSTGTPQHQQQSPSPSKKSKPPQLCLFPSIPDSEEHPTSIHTSGADHHQQHAALSPTSAALRGNARDLVVVNPSAFGKLIPTEITMQTARLVAQVANIESEDWARTYRFQHVIWPDQKVRSFTHLAQALANDVLVVSSTTAAARNDNNTSGGGSNGKKNIRIQTSTNMDSKGEGGNGISTSRVVICTGSSPDKNRTVFGKCKTWQSSSSRKTSPSSAKKKKSHLSKNEVLEEYGLVGATFDSILQELPHYAVCALTVYEVLQEDEIHDLLAPPSASQNNNRKVQQRATRAQGNRIQIRQPADRKGAIVEGLTEYPVDSLESLRDCLEPILVAASPSNAKPGFGSRQTSLPTAQRYQGGHVIVSLKIWQSAVQQDSNFKSHCATLTFVHLATGEPSQRQESSHPQKKTFDSLSPARTTHATPTNQRASSGSQSSPDYNSAQQISRRKEALASTKQSAFLKSSASSLGGVLRGALMREVGNESIIPWRQSILTKVLQRPLDHPESRVVVLASVSPLSDAYVETLATLRYVERLLLRSGLPKSPFEKRPSVAGKQPSPQSNDSLSASSSPPSQQQILMEQFVGKESILKSVVTDPRQRLARFYRSQQQDSPTDSADGANADANETGYMKYDPALIHPDLPPETGQGSVPTHSTPLATYITPTLPPPSTAIKFRNSEIPLLDTFGSFESNLSSLHDSSPANNAQQSSTARPQPDTTQTRKTTSKKSDFGTPQDKSNFAQISPAGKPYTAPERQSPDSESDFSSLHDLSPSNNAQQSSPSRPLPDTGQTRKATSKKSDFGTPQDKSNSAQESPVGKPYAAAERQSPDSESDFSSLHDLSPSNNVQQDSPSRPLPDTAQTTKTWNDQSYVGPLQGASQPNVAQESPSRNHYAAPKGQTPDSDTDFSSLHHIPPSHNPQQSTPGRPMPDTTQTRMTWNDPPDVSPLQEASPSNMAQESPARKPYASPKRRTPAGDTDFSSLHDIPPSNNPQQSTPGRPLPDTRQTRMTWNDPPEVSPLQEASPSNIAQESPARKPYASPKRRTPDGETDFGSPLNISSSKNAQESPVRPQHTAPTRETSYNGPDFRSELEDISPSNIAQQSPARKLYAAAKQQTLETETDFSPLQDMSPSNSVQRSPAMQLQTSTRITSHNRPDFSSPPNISSPPNVQLRPANNGQQSPARQLYRSPTSKTTNNEPDFSSLHGISPSHTAQKSPTRQPYTAPTGKTSNNGPNFNSPPDAQQSPARQQYAAPTRDISSVEPRFNSLGDISTSSVAQQRPGKQAGAAQTRKTPNNLSSSSNDQQSPPKQRQISQARNASNSPGPISPPKYAHQSQGRQPDKAPARNTSNRAIGVYQEPDNKRTGSNGFFREIATLESSVDAMKNAHFDIWQTSASSIRHLKDFQLTQQQVLNDLIFQRDSAVDIARKSEDECSRKLLEMEKLLRQKDSEILSLRDFVDSAQADRADVEKIAEEAIAAQDSLEQTVAEFERKLIAQRNSSQAAQEELKQLAYSKEQVSEELHDAKNEVFDLKSQLNEHHSNATDLEMQLQRLENECKRLARANSESEELIAKLREDLHLASENHLNEKEDQNRAMFDLKRENKELATKLRSREFDFEEQLESAAGGLRRCKEELQRTKEELVELKQQEKLMEGATETELASLRHQISQLKGALIRAQTERDDAEEHQERLREKCSEASQELDRTRGSLGQRLSDVEELSLSLQQALEDQEALREKLSRKEEALAQFQAETRRRVERVSKYREDAAQLVDCLLYTSPSPRD